MKKNNKNKELESTAVVVEDKKELPLLKKLKKAKEPLNIFNKIDYYSYYIYEGSKLNDVEFKEEVAVFEFQGMGEAQEFFTSNKLDNKTWSLEVGNKFMREFNFKILALRKKLILDANKKINK